MKSMTFALAAVFLFAPMVPSISVGEAFTVRVIDEHGRAVEHVQLTTDNGIVCYTKNNGEVRWTESSMMNRTVQFTIHRDGYLFPNGGATLSVTHGGRADLIIPR
jgi:hypothetical protein